MPLPFDINQGPFSNKQLSGGVSLRVTDLAVWETQATAQGHLGVPVSVELVTDNQPGNNEFWLLQRLIITGDNQVIGRVDLYEGSSASDRARRDWSILPEGYPLVDVYDPFVLIRSSQPVLIVISDIAAGDAFTVALSYVVVQKVIA